MTERMRIDRLLVERGLFESRAKAQAAIEAGLVVANAMPVTKASWSFRLTRSCRRSRRTLTCRGAA